MNEYRLKDNRGRVQRIAARSMTQALIALEEINRENDRQVDGGLRLATSWEAPRVRVECLYGTRLRRVV